MVCSNTIIYIVLYIREGKIFDRRREGEVGDNQQNYMTEKSDDSSGESFRQHSLTWRSESTLM